MPYEPREDSFLLEKHVARYSHGLVLDMGTGTGIQALAAATKASGVIALDIDPEAVRFCRQKIKDSKIEFYRSDLFEHLKSSNTHFDLIIFNPPYLPEHPGAEDVALDGGKKGHELLERFLSQANSYLKKDGSILIVFSSYTNKEKVDEIIMHHCLKHEELDHEKLDFEDLYIYLIKKSWLLKELEKRHAENVCFFAKGHRGMIYTAELDGKKIAVKAELPSSKARDRIENEARFLRIINSHGIGPRLLFSGKKYFAYHFIEGDLILDYIEKSSRDAIIAVLRDVMQQMHTLDSLGINKEEMHHPVKHIIVKDKPVLLDFERARHTQNPHNVTQFCQFIIHIAPILEKKGIFINKEEIVSLAKGYAQNRDLGPVLGVLR